MDDVVTVCQEDEATPRRLDPHIAPDVHTRATTSVNHAYARVCVAMRKRHSAISGAIVGDDNFKLGGRLLRE